MTTRTGSMASGTAGSIREMTDRYRSLAIELGGELAAPKTFSSAAVAQRWSHWREVERAARATADQLRMEKTAAIIGGFAEEHDLARRAIDDLLEVLEVSGHSAFEAQHATALEREACERRGRETEEFTRVAAESAEQVDRFLRACDEASVAQDELSRLRLEYDSLLKATGARMPDPFSTVQMPGGALLRYARPMLFPVALKQTPQRDGVAREHYVQPARRPDGQSAIVWSPRGLTVQSRRYHARTRILVKRGDIVLLVGDRIAHVSEGLAPGVNAEFRVVSEDTDPTELSPMVSVHEAGDWWLDELRMPAGWDVEDVAWHLANGKVQIVRRAN